MSALSRRLGAAFGERFAALLMRLIGRVLLGLFAISVAFFLLRQTAGGNGGQAGPLQYLQYLQQLAAADLGLSARTQAPVTGELLAALPLSLVILAAASLGGGALGVLVAVLGTLGRGARLARMALVAAGSVPVYGLAALAAVLGWNLLGLPSGNGLGSLLAAAVVLAIPVALVVARGMAFDLDTVMRQTYIRAARASGSSTLAAVRRHGLRNALRLPLASFGVHFAVLLASLPVVERLFSVPGIGAYLLGALEARDLPAAFGATLALATLYLAMDIVMAIARTVADPRLRLE